MVTRQYIGARYVPVIDGDWSATKDYEPLTVVLAPDGNSYTSRTFVPAGTPLTDATKWVKTGNYNAQVDAYRQEVDELMDDYQSELTVKNLKIKGSINSRILNQGTKTFGQGNNAAQVSIISNTGDEAFINGEDLPAIVGYRGIDTVGVSNQMHLEKDGTLVGKKMQVESVEADGVTVANYLNDEEDFIIEGGYCVLFTEDPATKPNSDDLSNTYIGVMTGEHTAHKIIVEEWYNHGDTTLTPVIPEGVLYAVPNCHTGLYLTLEDVMIDADSPDYAGVNGGESNFWDYKGVGYACKQYVLRRSSDNTYFQGLIVRNSATNTDQIVNGLGTQVLKLNFGHVVQNCNIPLRIDWEGKRIDPFNSRGIIQNPYIVTGKQLILDSQLTDSKLPTYEYDSVFTVFNTSESAITLALADGYTGEYYGTAATSYVLESRCSLTFYLVGSTKKYYVIDGSRHKGNQNVLFSFLQTTTDLNDMKLDSLSAYVFFNNTANSVNLHSEIGNIYDADNDTAARDFAVGAKKLAMCCYTGSTYNCMTLN